MWRSRNRNGWPFSKTSPLFYSQVRPDGWPSLLSPQVVNGLSTFLNGLENNSGFHHERIEEIFKLLQCPRSNLPRGLEQRLDAVLLPLLPVAVSVVPKNFRIVNYFGQQVGFVHLLTNADHDVC